MVGEKYVVFMVGSIVVVKDLSDKSEYFYSYPSHFNNVTAICAVSKEQKFKEKGKQMDQDNNPIYLPNTVPVKLYLAESSDSHDKLSSVVSLKPYKNRIRTMCTGMKGTIKELSVDRVKKTIACLLISPQSTYVVIFNYRK
jgi:hypothetical protein